MPPDASKVERLIFEKMHRGEPTRNYCQWDYPPRTDPDGKLSPASLLFYVAKTTDHACRLIDILLAIQQAIGKFRSVYGIKWDGSKWEFEIYIYDYRRLKRSINVDRLFDGTSGQLKTEVRVPDQLPYFMFSFDLNPIAADESYQINEIHVYIGNPGSTVSSGISYRFTKADIHLENFYFFFDAQTQREEIQDKSSNSVFLSQAGGWLDSETGRDLLNCDTICLANKLRSDTRYYSGIHVGQLIEFLHWQAFPTDFQDFVRDNSRSLDHLKFDIGIDFGFSSGKVIPIKKAVYSMF